MIKITEKEGREGKKKEENGEAGSVHLGSRRVRDNT